MLILCLQTDYFTPERLHSTAGVRTDLFDRTMREVRVSDYFAAVQPVEHTSSLSAAAAAHSQSVQGDLARLLSMRAD